MAASKNDTNLHSVWKEIKTHLSGQLTKASFNTSIQPLDAYALTDDGILELTCPAGRIEWVRYRLASLILKNAQSVLPAITQVSFQVTQTGKNPARNDSALTVEGSYHRPHNEIIKPDKVEVHTQYFRTKWRPLLGPLLSELIRELRQRCYYGRGENQQKKNSVEITLMELAAALGVSQSTVARALKRDKFGIFENPLLHFFIEEMTPIREYNPKKRKVTNKATFFRIYLDEPLIPADEEKLKATKARKNGVETA